MANTHGSLTTKKINTTGSLDFNFPTNQQQLFNYFRHEYRNINEIMVHVLDLHYFYASRVAIYIPLIWCSWIAVPHIRGDLRQYILRSLLAIASKETGTEYERFWKSVKILVQLLQKYRETKLNSSVIDNVLLILDDSEVLKQSYLSAFHCALIIVDLTKDVFLTPTIRSNILKDEFVKLNSRDFEEENFEQHYKYELEDGFNDEIIKSPLAYLLDKMTRLLEGDKELDDVERETTIQLLALNSL
jgi:hypothetical protein